MISEKLAGVYTKLEDKYFDVLDALDKKGIPIYNYSDFFENKGIPSFVVTVALIVAIIAILTLALTYQGASLTELTLSLKSGDGQSLNDVSLMVKDAKGETLFEGNASDGETIKLNRALFNGEEISITAESEGYQPTTIAFTISEGSTAPRISFDPYFEGIEASIRLIDSEGLTPVYDATVLANSRSNLSYQFVQDTNGVYKKTGVPAGVDLILKIAVEGYNDYEQTVTFRAGEVREVMLTPSNQGLAGEVNIAIDVSDSAGKSIDQAKVTVYDKRNSTVLFSSYTTDGTIVAKLLSGVPLRIVVEKQDYLTYDSDVDGGGVTVRADGMRFPVTLKLGGQKLHVTVLDSQSAFGVEGATVQLFRETGELIASQVASVSGTEFNGIDSNLTIYVTAHREGYLPTRQKVKVSNTEEVRILLNKITPTNSTRLDIYTIDKLGKIVNGVKILITDVNGSDKVPYGIPIIETTIAGYVNATVASGKTYEIKGYTDVLDGTIAVEVKQGEVDKKVYLKMQKKSNILEMKFIDVFGKDITGNTTISGLDGTTLFDGPITLGSVFFDAQQKDVVEVAVTQEDGNVFTENVTVKGKDYVEVMVYARDSTALTPTMEFIGIEDESGTSTNGIIPGAFFWAKFNVTFPRSATTGGVHFRVGQDTVTYIESEKFALYDLSMQNSTINYSTSYTPTPTPGNEVIDRANKGEQGSKNKWIEGTVSQPLGTYTVKVKVRAEDFLAGKVELKYRAWAVVGSEYYRTPTDSDLTTKGFSSNKVGLYAMTSTQDLTIYESLPECTEELCMSVNFVDEAEQFLNEKGFEAWKGKQYAIEIELSSKEQEYAQITVTTDSNIDFSSSQTTNFGFIKRDEMIGQVKKTAAAAVTIAKDGKQKVRFYFTAQQTGSAKINVSVVGKSTINKDVLFNVVEEKQLLVELSDNQIMLGRNFTVRVTDFGLAGVTNALVKIIDSEGKVAKSILGDATEGKGKNGYYRIQNNLGIGLYTVEISLTGYATQALPLMIATQNVLSFNDTIEAKLLVNQKSIVLTEALANESEFTVQNITIQTESENENEKSVSKTNTSSTASDSFKVVATTTPVLNKNQKQPVQITVSYLGDLAESADETTTITISGLVEGKFLTKVTSQIHMMYNKKLDPACLVVSPANAVLNLLGSEGSTDTTTLEITNNCETQLYIAKRIREKTTGALRGIQVDADNIELQPGETKNLTISAVNYMARGAVREQSFGFEIVYDSNAVKKTIPLTVRTINPIFALNYPPQITLYLAQTNVSEKATAAQPLFISNTSSFPIDNIQLSQAIDSLSQTNVKLTIEPTATVSLLPGQAISPPKILFATANSRITEPVKARIDISGTMGNLQNRSWQNDRYGYGNNYLNSTQSINNYSSATSRNYASNYGNINQMLGSIDVTVFYSGYNCLTGHVTESFFFPTEGGEIGKLIKIVNGCAEPVTIVGVAQASQAKSQTIFGMPPVMSSIMMGVPRVSVAPGQMLQVPLTIRTAIPSIQRQNYQVVLEAISSVSQTPITSKPFPVNISSGNSITSEHVKGTPVKVKVCGEQTETEVVIPKTVENANCAEGYCDAKNAVKYLAAKIEKVIQNARSQGYSYKNTVDNEVVPCQATGICTFEELNMVPEEFDLYLQNDRISPELLEAELNKVQYEGANTTPFRETTGATGMVVEPKFADLSIIRGLVLTGYYRRIFLDPAFAGCGYYKIAINGAFPAGPQGLDTMSPVLSVNAIPQNLRSSLLTNECISSIQNIANYNPVDAGLDPGREFGTWMTTVNSDTQLKDLATQISKSRYKSEKRVAQGIGNKVELKIGALSGILAQTCINANDKSTITVTIADTMLRTTDKATKDAFNSAIIKMVSDALNGSFGNNCLVKSGDTYSCVNLTDISTTIGTRQIALLNTSINFISQNGGCTSGTVYSNVPEALNFEVTPLNIPPATKNFVGIRRIAISADDSVNMPIATISKTPTGNTTVGTTTNSTTRQPNQPSTTQPTTGQPNQPSTTTQPSTTQPTTGQPNQPTARESARLNSQLPAYSSKAIETGEMYVIPFGAANGTVRIDKPLVLKENPSSSDYRYYRNVKICAEPSDSLYAGVDPQLAYIQANGVQFDVEVLNREAKENKGAAKQTITISTGTMHPEDIVMRIANGTLEAGKTYYLTAMWQGEPQTIKLEAYKNALVKQGKLEKAIIGGDEKTGSAAAIERTGKASAVEKYLLGCALTSVACNAWWGPANTILGVLGDCGVPLMNTALKQDFLLTSWGKTATKGAAAVYNAIISVLNVGFGVAGLGQNFLSKMDAERTIDIQPQSWSPATVQQTQQGALLWGATGGAGAQIIRNTIPGIGSRFVGTINKASIASFATEVGTSYQTAFETSLRGAIDTSSLTPAEKATIETNIKKLSKEYGDSVKTDFSKKLNEKYDTVWKRKSSLALTENNLYKEAVPETDKAIADALASTEKSPGTFLAKKEGGVTKIQELFGKDVTGNYRSIANVETILKDGTDFKLAFQTKFAPNASELGTKIADVLKKRGITNGVEVITPIANAGTDSSVKAVITEVVDTVPGLTPAEKSLLVGKIQTGLAGKSFTKATTKTVYYATKGWQTIPDVPASSVASILSDIETKTVSETTSFLKTSGKLAEFAADAGKQVDTAMEAEIKKGTGDLGKSSKLKNLVNELRTKRFGFNILAGLGCGVASNLIGMAAYDSSITATVNQQAKLMVTMPDILLTKGKTYMLKRNEKEPNKYEMYEVKDLAELSKPVLGRQPERLTTPADSKGRLPEELPLAAYPVITNRTTAREFMGQDIKGYIGAYAAGDAKQIDNSDPYIRFSNPDFLGVVHRYTGVYTLDCQENKIRIAGDKRIVSGAEPLAIAIGTTTLGQKQYTTKMITDEMNGTGTWLHDKLKTAMTERQAFNNSFNIEIAKKVFPNATQKDLERFVDDVAFWEAAYKSSSADPINYCP